MDKQFLEQLKPIIQQNEPYIGSTFYSFYMQELNEITDEVIQVTDDALTGLQMHYKIMMMGELSSGMDYENHKSIEDLKKMHQTFFLKCVNYSVAFGEIINFDKNLDKLLVDTSHAVTIDNFHMPYKSLFINKKFEIGKYSICGVSLNEINEDKVYACAFIVDEDWNVDTIMGNILFDKNVEHKDYNGDESSEKTQIILELRNYILNYINILNNPEKDIKRINVNPSQKKHRVKGGKSRVMKQYERPTTEIRVTGELRRYINYYNKQRIKIEFQKAFIVRGHWRHLTAERYKEKKAIWVKPYIKGSENKLVHKFVNIKTK